MYQDIFEAVMFLRGKYEVIEKDDHMEVFSPRLGTIPGSKIISIRFGNKWSRNEFDMCLIDLFDGHRDGHDLCLSIVVEKTGSAEIKIRTGKLKVIRCVPDRYINADIICGSRPALGENASIVRYAAGVVNYYKCKLHEKH